MGKVYKARNTRLDKTCALKVLPPELARQDPSLLERFIREARSSAAVEHPNVLPVYFIGRVEENCFIEMQYVDGGTLQDLMDQRGRLHVRSAALIIREVAKALQAAHEKGIIHRDIKPSNVMLSKKGQVFVADFGLAKIGKARTKLTQDGYVLGTPLYMSPEQALGQAVDHRSDIYSLGVMFYEMLVGSPPYTADSPLVVLRMHESAPIPDVTKLAPHTPPQIAALIRKMMAKQAEDRYQNCAEIAKQLKTYLAAATPPPVAPSPFMEEPIIIPVERRTPPRKGIALVAKRRSPWLIVVAAVALGILIGLRALYLGQKSGALQTSAFTSEAQVADGALRARPQGIETEGTTRGSAMPEAAPAKAVTIPPGWTSETKRVKVATPRGEQDKDITSYTNTMGMKLALIPAGEFMMGSPEGEEGRSNDEGPQHKVQITKPFFMGACEVTQAQYENIMGENSAHFKRADNPIESVSRENAVQFCERLSQKEEVQYRLPTEAEWEYACRAGSNTAYFFSNDDGSLAENAWYWMNSGRTTHPVGQKNPNAWGLYDMHGNVWEWCQDWYGENYYSSTTRSDPKGPLSGSHRVLRGGSWISTPMKARSAVRNRHDPAYRDVSYGFRVAVSPQE
jgi:formylglycine-generating enzyme required for sulfatase activity/tRNA A-37 threonylcarbamoyl transferase component Bud32